MTVIALLDTEMSDTDKGLIDCMIGLPETARAPALKDFDVKVSGLGSAEVIGVTPLAGQRRNAYRLTIRFADDAGLLCVRYRPERTATHGKKQGAGVDVTVMGSACRSTLDASGDEWHLPLDTAGVRPDARRTAEDKTPAPPRANATPTGRSASEPLLEARVLPLQRPAAAKLVVQSAQATVDDGDAERLPEVVTVPASLKPGK